ncbi:MAG: hypothetical protein ACKV2U_03055 [Bryobacteraceae bacterium]
MLNRLVFAAVIAGSGAPLPAIDFSGSWEVVVGKSDFGRAKPPQSLSMTVRQNDARLAVESRLIDARGPSTSTYTLDLSGKEAANVIRGNKIASISSWRGRTLHVKAKTVVQGKEVKTVDQWQLDESGRTLTVYRTATTPDGDIEQRFVYEKHLAKP